MVKKEYSDKTSSPQSGVKSNFKPHDTALSIVKEYIPVAFEQVNRAYKDKSKLKSNLERVLRKDPDIILELGSTLDDYEEESVEQKGAESLLNLAKLSINPSESRSMFDFYRYESEIDKKMSSQSFVRVLGDVVDKEIRSEMLRSGIGTGNRSRVSSLPDITSYASTVGYKADELSVSDRGQRGYGR